MFQFRFEISIEILFVLFIKYFSGLKFFKMLNLYTLYYLSVAQHLI